MQCDVMGTLAHPSRPGVLRGVIVPPHAQDIFCAVVELGEAVELAVAVVYGRLVDAVEG